MDKITKVLTLLSGGLDSTLAVKIMIDQGVDVEAVNFTTPFCLCDKCSVDRVEIMFGINVHRVYLGQEYLDLIANPPHGYGSHMNPCIDCRILMLKKAKEIAKKIGATSIVTGEVLNQRPFSQKKSMMDTIEKEVDLEGKILRPLSAKLLPITDQEKNGLLDREKLYSIQGRRRIQQIELAKSWGITDYPCPSGGCLLTDPQFSRKLRDFLDYNKKLTFKEIELLKIGRHFRIDGKKLIVGRNKNENQKLLSTANQENKPYLEVTNYMSPITLLEKNTTKNVTEKAASITARYSDAPKNAKVKVQYVGSIVKTLEVNTTDDLTSLYRI
jgi:tRNA U34 2-thiouridine synthase MnmA/TrmU